MRPAEAVAACTRGARATLKLPRFWPQWKQACESLVTAFMLLSLVSATPDAPNASADATTSCLLSEQYVRDMVGFFK
jgi:hypothetical protein